MPRQRLSRIAVNRAAVILLFAMIVVAMTTQSLVDETTRLVNWIGTE
jgi:hypothetical protein